MFDKINGNPNRPLPFTERTHLQLPERNSKTAPRRRHKYLFPRKPSGNSRLSRYSPAPAPGHQSEIRTFNQHIENGLLRTSDGNTVHKPVEAAFVRQDDILFYPIRAGLPTLIADEAVII